jgi:hypothetical protein
MKLQSLLYFAVDRLTAISKPKLFIVAFVVSVGCIIGFKKLGSKKHPSADLLPSDTAVYQDIAATAVPASQPSPATNQATNASNLNPVDAPSVSSPNVSSSAAKDGAVAAGQVANNAPLQNEAAKDAGKTKTIDQLTPEELKRKDDKTAASIQKDKGKAIDEIIDTNSKQNVKQSPSPAMFKYRFAQLGAFGSKESAKRLVQKVKKSSKQKDVKIMLEKKLVKKQVLFVVQAGPFKTNEDAKKFCQKLKSASVSQQCIVSK